MDDPANAPEVRLEITPLTKIGEILGAYPRLEDVLIARYPAFAKLKNPMIRQTVAKVATVAQAAKIAGTNPLTLVNALRLEVGQTPLADGDHGDRADGAGSSDQAAPEWVRPDRITSRIDADEFLARGNHPMGETRRAAGALPPDGILALTSSFYPAPLIESMRHSGFECWTGKAPAGVYITYLRKTG